MHGQPFFELIDHLNACEAAERAAVEEQVWASFGVRKAVLALDMSQFSLSVRRNGIVHYLRQIRRMQVLTRPIVEEWRGTAIKYNADNLMAVFEEPGDAIGAAVAANLALAQDPAAIAVAIGIDYGNFLMIPGQDCFGDAVNVAYKLGEDLAQPGEILITAAAKERLAEGLAHALKEQRVSISGLELLTYSVRYA